MNKAETLGATPQSRGRDIHVAGEVMDEIAQQKRQWHFRRRLGRSFSQ